MSNKDLDVHRERRRLSAEARNVAVQRLRDMYPDVWRRLYNEEAEKRGIVTHGSRREIRIRALERKLEELRGKS